MYAERSTHRSSVSLRMVVLPSVSLRMVVLVIYVTENGSIGRWRVRIHLDAKNLSIHLDEITSSRHIVFNTRYKTKLFIVMIPNYSLP